MTDLPPSVGRVPVVLDSITHLTPAHRGAVVAAASHGGAYSGYLAAKGGVRALLLNDAADPEGSLRHGALAYLQALEIPAATMDAFSARIGWGGDMVTGGVISQRNAAAAALGCRIGQGWSDAIACLDAAPMREVQAPPLREAAVQVRQAPVPVWCLDSISLVGPQHVGAIVVTGSHGGLLGGRPETAVKVDVAAAIYHDAGLGLDNAGVSRLPALDARGIYGAAVEAASAAVGDARAVLETGVISTVNDLALGIGCHPGQSTQDFIDRVTRAITAGAARTKTG